MTLARAVQSRNVSELRLRFLSASVCPRCLPTCSGWRWLLSLVLVLLALFCSYIYISPFGLRARVVVYFLAYATRENVCQSACQSVCLQWCLLSPLSPSFIALSLLVIKGNSPSLLTPMYYIGNAGEYFSFLSPPDTENVRNLYIIATRVTQ